MTEMGGVSRFFVNLFTGRRTARVFEWLVPNLGLPPSAVCLEIGAGNGDMARRFADGLRPSRYVATDLDPRQIEAARRHLATVFPGSIPASIELRAVDMLALPFPDASFDVVLAFQSLHHADEDHHAFLNVPKALAEMDRVLRPGGRFAYTEIMNQEKVRAWLTGHGFTVTAVRRRWTQEGVVAVKGSTASAARSIP